MDSPVCASQAAQAASWPWTRPLLDFQAPFVSTLPHPPSDARRQAQERGPEQTLPPDIRRNRPHHPFTLDFQPPEPREDKLLF